MKVRTEKSRRKAWSLNADVEIKARLSNKLLFSLLLLAVSPVMLLPSFLRTVAR